ncbi:hypothetical protein ABEO75_14500 [Paenibacillus macerans]|uniref:hypothetical protein n=1 Tax=Paenibacillus macerans TaxID=44252 RepID=UPI002E1E77E5|nr:hypothetical protein [Paenibacillus macerans]
MNHEETDLSPAFRSAGSFIAALEQNPNHDWDDLKKDYPQGQNNNNESSAADLQSIEQINHMLQPPQFGRCCKMPVYLQCYGVNALQSIGYIAEVFG